MHEAALNPLRARVTGKGTLPPAALAKWKADYGPALRALDEVAWLFLGLRHGRARDAGLDRPRDAAPRRASRSPGPGRGGCAKGKARARGGAQERERSRPRVGGRCAGRSRGERQDGAARKSGGAGRGGSGPGRPSRIRHRGRDPYRPGSHPAILARMLSQGVRDSPASGVTVTVAVMPADSVTPSGTWSMRMRTGMRWARRTQV